MSNINDLNSFFRQQQIQKQVQASKVDEKHDEQNQEQSEELKEEQTQQTQSENFVERGTTLFDSMEYIAKASASSVQNLASNKLSTHNAVCKLLSLDTDESITKAKYNTSGKLTSFTIDNIEYAVTYNSSGKITKLQGKNGTQTVTTINCTYENGYLRWFDEYKYDESGKKTAHVQHRFNANAEGKKTAEHVFNVADGETTKVVTLFNDDGSQTIQDWKKTGNSWNKVGEPIILEPNTPEDPQIIQPVGPGPHIPDIILEPNTPEDPQIIQPVGPGPHIPDIILEPNIPEDPQIIQPVGPGPHIPNIILEPNTPEDPQIIQPVGPGPHVPNVILDPITKLLDEDGNLISISFDDENYSFELSAKTNEILNDSFEYSVDESGNLHIKYEGTEGSLADLKITKLPENVKVITDGEMANVTCSEDISLNLVNNGTLNCVIGSKNNDTIENNGTIKLISGNEGDDRIINNGKALAIQGGEGNDNITNNGKVTMYVYGNEGNDTITNEITGEVRGSGIWGNLGDNTIINKGKSQGLYGGTGDDKIINEETGTTDRIATNGGADKIINRGEVVYGIGAGEDTFIITNENGTWYVNGDEAVQNDDDTFTVTDANKNIQKTYSNDGKLVSVKIGYETIDLTNDWEFVENNDNTYSVKKGVFERIYSNDGTLLRFIYENGYSNEDVILKFKEDSDKNIIIEEYSSDSNLLYNSTIYDEKGKRLELLQIFYDENNEVSTKLYEYFEKNHKVKDVRFLYTENKKYEAEYMANLNTVQTKLTIYNLETNEPIGEPLETSKEYISYIEKSFELGIASLIIPSSYGPYLWENLNLPNTVKSDIDMLYTAHEEGLKASGGVKDNPEYKTAFDNYVSSQMVKTISEEINVGDVVETETGLFVYDGTELKALNMTKEQYLELFPPVERYATQQGGTGDCYFIADLVSWMNNPRTYAEILQMITVDSNTGDTTVTFDGLPDYSVTFPNGELFDMDYEGDPKWDWGEKQAWSGASGAKGCLILEQAYAIVRFADEQEQVISTIDIDDAMSYIYGGFSQYNSRVLFGENIANQVYSPNSDILKLRLQKDKINEIKDELISYIEAQDEYNSTFAELKKYCDNTDFNGYDAEEIMSACRHINKFCWEISIQSDGNINVDIIKQNWPQGRLESLNYISDSQIADIAKIMSKLPDNTEDIKDNYRITQNNLTLKLSTDNSWLFNFFLRNNFNINDIEIIEEHDVFELVCRYIEGTSEDNTMDTLAKQLQNNEISIQATFNSTILEKGIISWHGYSVNNIDTKNKTISVINSWAGGVVINLDYDEFIEALSGIQVTPLNFTENT